MQCFSQAASSSQSNIRQIINKLKHFLFALVPESGSSSPGFTTSPLARSDDGVVVGIASSHDLMHARQVTEVLGLTLHQHLIDPASIEEALARAARRDVHPGRAGGG